MLQTKCSYTIYHDTLPFTLSLITAIYINKSLSPSIFSPYVEVRRCSAPAKNLVFSGFSVRLFRPISIFPSALSKCLERVIVHNQLVSSFITTQLTLYVFIRGFNTLHRTSTALLKSLMISDLMWIAGSLLS